MALSLTWNGVTICQSTDLLRVLETPQERNVTKGIGYPGSRGMALKVVDRGNTPDSVQRWTFEAHAYFSTYAAAKAKEAEIAARRIASPLGTLAWELPTSGYSESVGSVELADMGKPRPVRRNRGASGVFALVFPAIVFVRYG